MIINTMHFGEIEIDEKSIIHFEEGLPGFEEVRKFVLLTDENNEPFRWLQAIGNENPAFAIISPFEIKEDYEIDIDETTENLLDLKDLGEAVVYSVVVIPEDITKMTANLKAPIIINSSNNKGRQMVMNNSPYEVKHYILDEILKVNASKHQEGK